MDQEIITTALRKEAADALSSASYKIRHEAASLAEVQELMERATRALEMSLPTVTTISQQRRA